MSLSMLMSRRSQMLLTVSMHLMEVLVLSL